MNVKIKIQINIETLFDNLIIKETDQNKGHESVYRHINFPPEAAQFASSVVIYH